MRVVITEKDRQDVARFCWNQCRNLPLSRGDRKLVATQLELNWWRKWREQQAKSEP